jgi:hypothetical protein
MLYYNNMLWIELNVVIYQILFVWKVCVNSLNKLCDYFEETEGEYE